MNEKRKRLDSGIPLTADEEIDIWEQEKASMEVRKAIFEQAKNGSTPAQKQMIDLIQGNIQKKRRSADNFNMYGRT